MSVHGLSDLDAAFVQTANLEVGGKVVSAAEIPLGTPDLTDIVTPLLFKLATLVQMARVIFDLCKEVAPILDDCADLRRIDHSFLRTITHTPMVPQAGRRVKRCILWSSSVNAGLMRTQSTHLAHHDLIRLTGHAGLDRIEVVGALGPQACGSKPYVVGLCVC